MRRALTNLLPALAASAPTLFVVAITLLAIADKAPSR
jgi:hypothetical protein